MLLAIGSEYRMGKSFFLNLCLRYLYHRRSGTSGDWLAPDVPLENRFFSKRQSDAVTKGINIWPEPFFVKNAAGEEVAVLLSDAQGNFDDEMGMKDNSIIFGMSTLISSILVKPIQLFPHLGNRNTIDIFTQIFNVNRQVDSRDSEYLRLFAEYAKTAGKTEKLNQAPFQVILF